jgi:hypothetical protein
MSYLLSKRHFRRHEPYLVTLIANFPATTTFDVVWPITQPDILARNLRYAGKSLLESQWQPTDVDMAKFVQVWDEITISSSLVQNKVVCGPTATLRKQGMTKATPRFDVEASPTQLVSQINVIDPPLALIHAVLLMHHFRHLIEPSKITTTRQLPEIKLGLEHTYGFVLDLAVSYENQTYTIL